jgi:hypothetical protein
VCVCACRRVLCVCSHNCVTATGRAAYVCERTAWGPLGSLSNLQDLDLSAHGPSHHNSVAPDLYPALDITPLALCGQLVYLNLRFRNVEDLSPLATCTNPRKVILDDCPWPNRTTELGSCLQLTYVSLQGSAVHCICDLIGCKRLNMLDITRCWKIHLPVPELL